MNTKAYTAVRSQYLRDLIRHTRWDARKGKEYIDDLIRLEEHILRRPGYSFELYEGINYSRLKRTYRREFETLCRELNPKELKKGLKRQEEEQTSMEEYTEQLKEEEKQKRKDWIEAGGKL